MAGQKAKSLQISPTIPQLEIRELSSYDREWVNELSREQWGAEIVVAHSQIFKLAELAGFIATLKGKKVGLITFNIHNKECEIVTLNSLKKGMGVGRALIDRVKETAMESDCKRLWLVTTNDNLDVFRFYQKYGFHLCKVHIGAVLKSRKIKPEIPQIGQYGIPIRDELELEILLGQEK